MNGTKDIWDDFLNNWSIQYFNAKCILKFLNSYPTILSALRIEEVIDIIELDKMQKEWLWLCSKFDNPIETDFLKPYWVPIQVNSYDYFIDLSDNNFPIFEIHFFFFEPFRWYQKFLTKDIKEVLLAPDTGLNIKKVLDKHEKVRWDQVDEFFKERKILGYTGKIYVAPVSYNDIMTDDSELFLPIEANNESFISLKGVSSLIIGLLPYSTKIKVEYVIHKFKHAETIENIKIIRDLVFYLRETGFRSVEKYRIKFIGFDSSFFEFVDREFTFYHTVNCYFNDFCMDLDRIITENRKMQL